MTISTRSGVSASRFRPLSDPGASVDLAKAVAMSLGVQHDDKPLGDVIADELDPEGGGERGKRALMVICGIPIGPENDGLGVIIGLDPD
jgi:hypothetical protein